MLRLLDVSLLDASQNSILLYGTETELLLLSSLLLSFGLRPIAFVDLQSRLLFDLNGRLLLFWILLGSLGCKLDRFDIALGWLQILFGLLDLGTLIEFIFAYFLDFILILSEVKLLWYLFRPLRPPISFSFWWHFVNNLI